MMVWHTAIGQSSFQVVLKLSYSLVELWLKLEVIGIQTNLALLERKFILVYHTKSPPKTLLEKFLN